MCVKFSKSVWRRGRRPAAGLVLAPGQAHELPPVPAQLYQRPAVPLWTRLKKWRTVATRLKKTASSFLDVLRLAATIDWLKR